MEIISFKTPLIKPGEDLAALFFKIFRKFPLKNKDILVMASKIVAVSQNRLVELNRIKPSKKARQLGKRYDLPPAFCELVIKEADKVMGGVKKALLTRKNGNVVANAGMDLSNVKPGWAVLWPKNIEGYLDQLRKLLEKRFKKRIGLLVIDSHCSPLRLGTRGLALFLSGFEGLIDERGKKDLFGRKIRITRVNLADELASAASSLMGERNQRRPIAVIRGAPITLSKKSASALTKKLLISPEACLFRDYRVR